MGLVKRVLHLWTPESYANRLRAGNSYHWPFCPQKYIITQILAGGFNEYLG